MHPLLTRIATEKPDVIYFPIFVAAAAQILRQAKETPGWRRPPMIGGGSLSSARLHRGRRAPSWWASASAIPTFRRRRWARAIRSSSTEYKKAYGEAPISGYHANAYDGASWRFDAIKKVAKSHKDGNLYIGKKAFRDAVFSIKFAGISGPIACDTYGECSEFKPSCWSSPRPIPRPSAIGKNPKKIWP